jgi:hypothetical protein
MNVVCNPADASGRGIVFFGNSAQEWPEPFPKLRVQHRGTLFGAENTMNIEEQKVLAMADDILAFRILTKHFTKFVFSWV